MAHAPDVTLTLGLSGWHSVYRGFWNPHHDYDGDTTIKLKLTGDPCFQPISDRTYAGAAAAPLNWTGTQLREEVDCKGRSTGGGFLPAFVAVVYGDA
jgi:hypothetical protein